MSSSAPDPSMPNQMDARIRQIVYDILNDPLSYPPGMTNWLTTFVGLNSAQTGLPVSSPTNPTAP